MKHVAALRFLAALAVTTVLLAMSPSTDAHPGHWQIELLPFRYDLPPPATTNPQQAWIDWMTLSTDYHFECCQATFQSPVEDAVANWNARNHTIYMSYYATHTADRRVHIMVKSDSGSFALGWMQPWVREDSPPYAWGPCSAYQSSCLADKTHVVINAYRHTGGYATYVQRRHTVAHELGHAFALNEHYGCPNGVTEDDSVMDGDCSHMVQPLDVCGVNHSYHDPWWGYAGCVSN